MPDSQQNLEQRVRELEGLVRALIYSDRYVFQRDIEIQDGRNIQLATGTGTMIGTSATTQKLGFLGATPVIQQGSINSPAANVGSLQNAVDSLITVLETFGFINQN